MVRNPALDLSSVHQRTVKTAELTNIQFLRAVAAVSVIFVHFAFLLACLDAYTFGRGGVDLFFVISGFIMVYTTRDREKNPSLFFRNRASRVIPIYWLLTLAAYVLAAVFPRLMNTTVASLSDLLRSLFFIPYVKGSGRIQPVLYVGWTLNYEMFFYLVFTAGLCIRSRALGRLFTLSVLSALVLAGLLLHPSGPVALFYTDPIQLEFAMGMLVGMVWPRLEPGPLRQWQTIALAVAFLACLGAVIMKDFIFRFPSPFLIVVATGLLCAVTLFLAVLLERGGHKATLPFLLAIGDASYSLYLVQPFTTEAFERIGMQLHANCFTAIGLMALCVAITIGAALICYRLVEKPLTIAARRLWPLRAR